MSHLITHDELLERLSYDPHTGIFTWLKTTSNRIKIGAEAGHQTRDGYRSINFQGKNFLAHRLAWFYFYKEFPSMSLDHINRNRLDNRIANLRIATFAENNMNQTGKGYTFWKRDNKWKAQIQIDKRNKHLGYFDTKEEAALAYLAAKKKYHSTWSQNV